MVRSRLVLLIASLCLGTLGLSATGAFQGEPRVAAAVVNPQAQVRVELPAPAQEIRDKLSRAVNLPKGIDPNTPLKETLEFLGELHDTSIVIDKAAFRAIGANDIEQLTTGLPRIGGVSFAVVLQQVLSQLEPSATYVIRNDHLVVTTSARTCPAQWQHGQRQLVPKVDVQFDRLPLELALRNIAVKTGVNIVLDARAAEKAKAPVTIMLTQAAVDTTVVLLADMADLTALPLESVLYVTTRANADALKSDLEKRDLKDRLMPGSNPAPNAAK
jgi:hypothetical protein